MRQLLACCAFLAAVAGLPACRGPKVLVPPRMDLRAYSTLGIVAFSSNATGNLEGYATQRFIQSVQAAQRGVRFLELGSEAEVLRKIGRTRLDFEAVRAIGQQWGVDAVFTGELDVTPVTPRVRLERWVESLSVQADVQATLHARLLEAAGGATLWTSSGRATRPVAHVSIAANRPVDFSARDPQQAYGALVSALVGQLTDDFYSHWERH